MYIFKNNCLDKDMFFVCCFYNKIFVSEQNVLNAEVSGGKHVVKILGVVNYLLIPKCSRIALYKKKSSGLWNLQGAMFVVACRIELIKPI